MKFISLLTNFFTKKLHLPNRKEKSINTNNKVKNTSVNLKMKKRPQKPKPTLEQKLVVYKKIAAWIKEQKEKEKLLKENQ